MGKAKNQATGQGYLGEIMVLRTTGAVGIVENVTPGGAGWPPQIALKLKDGSVKTGSLNKFREPRASERRQLSPE